METATANGGSTMSEWPEGWFRGEKGSSAGESDGADATVSVPGGAVDADGQYQVRHYPGDPAAGPTQGLSAGAPGAAPPGAAPPGAWPAQPPPSSRPGRPSRPPGSGGGIPGLRAFRAWSRRRQILVVLGVVIALIVAGTASTYFYLNSKLHRQNILVSYAGRPAPGSGTNWLIAGSDSRQGLTVAQERAYSTGFSSEVAGGRSDTILILHIPSGGGRPLLISIPRDSYVNIPGYGPNKINAAFDFGGPKLLAETVQDATGLYINHFMDIGFGGFVNVVNDVGGVRMCLTAALHDVASGVNLKAGCQTLSGGQALAYVRDRHDFTTQDLQREQDQRIFLKALLSKMTSPSVMLNPFKILPAASGAASTLTVDSGTSLYDLYQAAEAMRNPLTTTVPIASANYVTSAGDSVLWNSSEAKELFNDLQAGKPVPSSLITGSKQGT
jgi:LCP family protein required for cell wall assembly